LGCRCAAGYACTYAKRIVATLGINCSLADFNNNVNNVKTNFINAIAAAAGVTPDKVKIGGGRRALVLAGISLEAEIIGAQYLAPLAGVMAWEPRHSVRARRMLLSL
jgi:hypothetical protein